MILKTHDDNDNNHSNRNNNDNSKNYKIDVSKRKRNEIKGREEVDK